MRPSRDSKARSAFLVKVALFVFLLAPLAVFGATADELREQISQKNTQIADLEREIAQFEQQLQKVGQEKQTLQSAIKTLDISRNKISTDIRLTEQKIAARDLEIEELTIEIGATAERIGENSSALASMLREVDQIERQSLLESFLASDRLTDVWTDIDSSLSVQGAITDHVNELEVLKADREDKRVLEQRKRQELATYRAELAGQKRALDDNRAQKNTLLKQTQNKESEYQKILEEKRRLHEQFETDLRNAENELKLIIDPNSIPSVGKGVLAWPLDSIRITQTFGTTAFSTANPQVYNGRGHNGIDLAASPGTRVKSALSGIVKGTGDTDLTCPNASYGKWVLVEHANGLSTLYAHLSSIGVSQGQQVSTGQIVGYSGNTGYSTGPHLHFTVYATQGVKISTLASKAIGCKGRVYTLPIADTKGYLNPLSYL